MIHVRPTRKQWKPWRPPPKPSEPPEPRPGDSAEQIISDALGPRRHPLWLSCEVMAETNRRYGL